MSLCSQLETLYSWIKQSKILLTTQSPEVQCVPSLIPSPMKALRRQWYFYHRAYNRVWAHFSCIWNRKHLGVSVYDISNYLHPKKQSIKLWRWISLFFGGGSQGEGQWLYFPKLFVKIKHAGTPISLCGERWCRGCTSPEGQHQDMWAAAAVLHSTVSNKPQESGTMLFFFTQNNQRPLQPLNSLSSAVIRNCFPLP